MWPSPACVHSSRCEDTLLPVHTIHAAEDTFLPMHTVYTAEDTLLKVIESTMAQPSYLSTQIEEEYSQF